MSSVNSVSTSLSSSSLHNSTTSSSDSLAFSSSSATSYTRCQGLDLLLKAVYYVDNSIIGVPFVRKRVLIRRRRRSAAAYAFSDFVLNELFNSGRIGSVDESKTGNSKMNLRDPIPKAQRRRRSMTMPLKYRDSVIETWKRQTRGGRSIWGVGSDQV